MLYTALCHSFQALELDGGGGGYLTHLNYAVTLLNNDEPERAAEHYASFKKMFEVGLHACLEIAHASLRYSVMTNGSCVST